MKRAFTVALPRNEQRMKSPAWFAFVRNIDRAILKAKISEAKKK